MEINLNDCEASEILSFELGKLFINLKSHFLLTHLVMVVILGHSEYQ